MVCTIMLQRMASLTVSYKYSNIQNIHNNANYWWLAGIFKIPEILATTTSGWAAKQMKLVLASQSLLRQHSSREKKENEYGQYL